LQTHFLYEEFSKIVYRALCPRLESLPSAGLIGIARTHLTASGTLGHHLLGAVLDASRLNALTSSHVGLAAVHTGTALLGGLSWS
jgi:hypothetical protein